MSCTSRSPTTESVAPTLARDTASPAWPTGWPASTGRSTCTARWVAARSSPHRSRQHDGSDRHPKGVAIFGFASQTGRERTQQRVADMSGDMTAVPDALPVLSRGKHRSPKKGACFMEFASYLAGERWSDHPACTHPLLAAVARHVNDYTSDAGRSRLVELIPSVIGLTGDDLRIDAG